MLVSQFYRSGGWGLQYIRHLSELTVDEWEGQDLNTDLTDTRTSAHNFTIFVTHMSNNCFIERVWTGWGSKNTILFLIRYAFLNVKT